ncbi:hypothetical protein [Stomatobaculum longum]
MENAKEIVEFIGGLIVIIGAVAAVLRYATATPLDRLMMDGIDKTGVKIYPFFLWWGSTAIINLAIEAIIFALADAGFGLVFQEVIGNLLAFISAAIIMIPIIFKCIVFIRGKARYNKKNVCLVLNRIYFILIFVFVSPYITYYLAKTQAGSVKALAPLAFVSIFETVNIFVTCKNIFRDDPKCENIFINCSEKDFCSNNNSDNSDLDEKKWYRCLEIKDGYVFCTETLKEDEAKIVRLISLERLQERGISFETGDELLGTPNVSECSKKNDAQQKDTHTVKVTVEVTV